MDKDIKIDCVALELLKLINSYNYDAYIVGGAIRNILLGITPNDYDICTNMPIQQLIELFPAKDVEVKGKEESNHDRHSARRTLGQMFGYYS